MRLNPASYKPLTLHPNPKLYSQLTRCMVDSGCWVLGLWLLSGCQAKDFCTFCPKLEVPNLTVVSESCSCSARLHRLSLPLSLLDFLSLPLPPLPGDMTGLGSSKRPHHPILRISTHISTPPESQGVQFAAEYVFWLICSTMFCVSLQWPATGKC